MRKILPHEDNFFTRKDGKTLLRDKEAIKRKYRKNM